MRKIAIFDWRRANVMNIWPYLHLSSRLLQSGLLEAA